MIKTVLKLIKMKMMDEVDGFSLIKKIKSKTNTTEEDYLHTFVYGEPYTEGHTVFSEQILLGFTHVSLALESFATKFPVSLPVVFSKVIFVDPVIIEKEKQVTISSSFTYVEEGIQFKIIFEETDQKNVSFSDVGASAASTGHINYYTGDDKPITIDRERLLNEATTCKSGKEIYESLEKIKYSPALQTLDKVYLGKDYSFARLEVSSNIKDSTPKFHLHPALIDGAVLSVLSQLLTGTVDKTFIPLFIESIIVYESPSTTCWCLGHIKKKTDELLVCDLSLCDEQGNVTVSLKGVSCKKVTDASVILKETGFVDREKTQKSNKVFTKKSKTKTMQFEELLNHITTYLINKLSSHLDNDVSIELEKNYMDIGLESAMLIQIANEIESEVNITLYPTLFFEYQCVKDLSDYFYQEFPNEFAQFLNIVQKDESDNKTGTIEKNEQRIKPKSINKEDEKDVLTKKSSTNGTLPHKEYKDSDIAVIGMAGVFSDSKDTEEFWDHLYNGTDLIKEIPVDHFDYRSWYDPSGQKKDSIYCKWGSFIKDVDQFDAEFFNMVSREAELTDPQLRHLLHVLYTTIDDAGYMNSIKGSDTGMFVGACFHDYQTQMVSENKTIEPYDGIGNSPTMLSNRPSFYFDLKGPSITVDTACSSSLVALHLACKALQNGECSMAFAAGVNLLLTPGHYLYFCNIGALSKSGRSHTFDSRADGYIPGEGIASVLLKPLDKALEDGDQIHGIIKGSGIKHSGYTSTITAPNVQGEVDVITSAWQKADVDPTTISYIEAHGTGTKLGDPIEVQAIQKAFHTIDSPIPFSCAIGSAKAHIGHLEGAAGIAGVIKVLVSMKNKIIPAMPKFEKLNPFIKLEEKGPLYINLEPIEWKTNSPRRAGVNSFGFGGTFAHVVLEEAPRERQQNKRVVSQNQHLILLSSKKLHDLKNAARDLNNFLNKMITQGRVYNELLADMAYTLQVGRRSFSCRVGFLVNNTEELQKKLEVFISEEDVKGNHVYGDIRHYKDITGIFDKDEYLKNSLNLYTEGDYSFKNILDLWAKGFKFDWSSLHKGAEVQIISLPSYPFSTKSFWYKKRHFKQVYINEILEKINEEEREQPVHELEGFKEGFVALEKLCVETLVYWLNRMKLYDQLKTATTSVKVAKRLKLSYKYNRFIQQALFISKEFGYLKNEEDQFVLLKKPSTKKVDINNKIRSFNKKHPELKAYSTLVNLMLTKLQGILTGKVRATEVLFHQDNIAILEQIYNNNVVATYFNNKIGDFIQQYLQNEYLGKEKVTILEIGAGVGGTTDKLLPRINFFADKLHYIYTDISPKFQSFAEKYQKKYPFVKFSRLDVEKSAEAQGLDNIQADIILCSNVLHATSEINNSLTNIKTFLKPNGILLINEVTSYQHFLTVTFGLVDGWWLFKDENQRISGSPLLSLQNWIEKMEDIGYVSVQSMRQSFEGQHIIIGTKERLAPPHDQSVTVNSSKAVSVPVPRARSSNASSEVSEDEKGSKSFDEFRKIIAGIVSKMTQVTEDRIDASQNFIELGIDSITGVEFIQRINKFIGTRLQLSALLNNSSINLLAKYLAEQELESIKLERNKYDRYNVDLELYEKLKAEKKLKGKMNVSKLFELTDKDHITTSEALLSVYAENQIRIEKVEMSTDIEMEVILSGSSGDVLVLCSPLNSLATIWQHQLSELGKKYQLVIPHYPGFGDSGMIEGDFGIEEVGDMIVELLNKLQFNTPYNLIGWSMGGLIAQAIAERHPDDVNSLILLGTGTISMFDDDYYKKHIHVKQAIREEVVNSVVQNNNVMEDDRLLVATYNTIVLTHYASKIKDFDHKVFRDIKAPVLILNGKKDKVLHPKYAQSLKDNFPRAEYVEIEEGGHFLALTHPAIVNKYIQDFITHPHQKSGELFSKRINIS